MDKEAQEHRTQWIEAEYRTMGWDEEAQEKIERLIREKPHIYSCLYVHSTGTLSKEILLLMEELGYRKLPDKPPLLSDEELNKFIQFPVEWYVSDRKGNSPSPIGCLC